MKRLLLLILVLLAALVTLAEDPLDGYTSKIDGMWVPGYISLDTWFRPAPVLAKGAAVWYGPYAMAATAQWRGLDLTGYVGGVALMSPADIGETVWLRRPGFYRWEGPYLDVDCAMRGDEYPIIVGRGEIIEVDFYTAIRWGMVSGNAEEYTVNAWRLQGVTVFVGEYPYNPGYQPIDYPSWWARQITFTQKWQDNPLFVPPHSWRMPDGKVLSYADFVNHNPVRLAFPDFTLIASHAWEMWFKRAGL